MNTIYIEQYRNLMINAHYRQNLEGYYEKHHIIPKSIKNQMGSTEILYFSELPINSELLIKLTAEEHYDAHLLLVNIFEEHDQFCYKKMLCAWNMMSNSGKYSNKEYDTLREKHSKILSKTMRSEGNNRFGSNHREDTKKLMSDIAKKNNQVPPNQTGMRRSDETIKNLINSHLGQIPWNKGVPCSEARKIKQSETMKNKDLSQSVKKRKETMKNNKIKFQSLDSSKL